MSELLAFFSWWSIDSIVTSTLNITSYFYTQNANVNRSLNYIKNILNSYVNEEQAFCFAVVKHFLKLILNHQPMLARAPVLNYTESDYMCTIWLKLFQKMFPAGNNIIRIKAGESIFDFSTAGKKEVYYDSKNVKAFKIDIRFLVEVERKEIDIAAAEVAKDDSKTKTISDEGKLTREGKDIVDNLVDIIPNNDLKSSRAYLFQIACNICILSTLDLACNGLYIATLQTHFVLPSQPDNLSSLDLPLAYLLDVKSNMESLGLKIKSVLSNGRMGIVENLGVREPPPAVSECTNWTRSTYYSPSDKAPSIAPSFVFGDSPSSILNNLKEAYQVVKGKDNEEDDSGFDDFGWKLLANGRYYNKSRTDCSTLEEYHIKCDGSDVWLRYLK